MSPATELPSGAVAAAWSWYVVHKNAPGAISAIAFMVAPVSPSVAFTSPVPLLVETSAIGVTLPCCKMQELSHKEQSRCHARSRDLERVDGKSTVPAAHLVSDDAFSGSGIGGHGWHGARGAAHRRPDHIDGEDGRVLGQRPGGVVLRHLQA